MIGRRTRNGRPQYLTKWKGLGYAESTWETERALAQDQVRMGCAASRWETESWQVPALTSLHAAWLLLLQEHIERYQRFNQPPEEKEEQEQRELNLNAGGCGVIAAGDAMAKLGAASRCSQPAHEIGASTQPQFPSLQCSLCSPSCLHSSCLHDPAYRLGINRPSTHHHSPPPFPPAVPDFLNGRSLRDYQQVSLQWMVANWSENRNCILGDEVREAARLGVGCKGLSFLHTW